MNYRKISPGALLAPVPAILVTSLSPEGVPNALAVAWSGTVCSHPPMVSISLRPERYSYGLIRNRGEFVISLVSQPLLKALDYCGVRSGREEDKFSACGLAPLPMEELQTPGIDGSPLCLGCKVTQILPLGSHDLFLAEIISARIREDLVDSAGRIALEKADLAAYNHGLYQSLGDILGFFGYSVAAPEVLKKRMESLKKRL